MRRAQSTPRRVSAVGVSLVLALAMGGCGFFGDNAECQGGRTRCSETVGVVQDCSGGEGYYYWTNRACPGLKPVCVSATPYQATCEDHADRKACASGIESLVGSVPMDWSPKGMGDFDGDGVTDLLFLGGDDRLRLVRGSGGGAFAPPTTIPTAVSGPFTGIRPADVDGDGRLDLVLATAVPPELSVLVGNGDGTFTDGHRFAVTGALSLEANADMDGDGRDEIVAKVMYASSEIDIVSHLADADLAEQRVAVTGPTGPVEIDYGAGAATFTRSKGPGLFGLTGDTVEILLAGGGSYRDVFSAKGGFAVADLNGDGLVDVLGRSDRDVSTNPAYLLVYLSAGDSTFREAIASNVPSGFDFIGAGDVDGDHQVDLVTRYESDMLAVSKGNGDGRQDLAARSTSGGLVVLSGACTTP